VFGRKSKQQLEEYSDRIKDIHATLRLLEKRTYDLESATFPLYAKERAIHEMRYLSTDEAALAQYRNKSPRDT
jgi:hypothetical protein